MYYGYGTEALTCTYVIKERGVLRVQQQGLLKYYYCYITTYIDHIIPFKLVNNYNVSAIQSVHL